MAIGTEHTVTEDSHRFHIGGEEKLRIDTNGSLQMATSAAVTTANASALIDLVSTNKGLGLPAMTTTQRNAISSPRVGLAIYNTTTSTVNIYTANNWYTINMVAG